MYPTEPDTPFKTAPSGIPGKPCQGQTPSRIVEHYRTAGPGDIAVVRHGNDADATYVRTKVHQTLVKFSRIRVDAYGGFSMVTCRSNYDPMDPVALVIPTTEVLAATTPPKTASVIGRHKRSRHGASA